MILQVLIVITRVAFYTLLERKILGYIQVRKGPNKPSILGLFVPFADAIKLFTKELSVPTKRNNIFLWVPCLALFIPLFIWIIYPTEYSILSFKYSTLLFICISAVGVYAILGAGWGSNRKYSMLGAVRAVAQTVSYEVRLSIIIVHRIIFYLYEIQQNKITNISLYLFMIICIFLVSSIAETNRSPFDFTEGESELVRGFNTEYSSIHFVIIFLAEYISIIFISTLVSLLFNIRSYSDLWFFITIWAVFFIWARGSLPRFRYDQLMFLAWKCFLPVVLSSVALTLLV